MSLKLILDQFTAAVAGYALGIMSAAWLHAMWKFWHPHTIRFWGTWYTNPRLLVISGIGLAVGWIVFIVKAVLDG